MQKKVLGIVAVNYPYGTGEPFLHMEIIELCKYFHQIYIFLPEINSINTKNQVFELPVNVQVIGINNSYRLTHKVFSVIRIGPLKFLTLLKTARKEYKLPFSKRIFQRILYYEAKQIDFRKILLNKIESLNIDKNNLILYSYWFTEYTYALAKLKLEFPELKVFTRAHGWDIYFERHTPAYLPFRKYTIPILDGTFTISEHGKDYLLNKTHLNNHFIQVSYLGVDAQNYNPYVFDGHTLRILSLAFVSPVKNIELLIEALSTIKYPVHWTHIGDDNSKYSLSIISLANEKLSQNNNVKFQFLGKFNQHNIHNYLDVAEIDLLVNTSYSEGLPVSIMEVFAHGIPAIAPRIGGIAEIIDHHINGYILNTIPTVKEIEEAFSHYINLSIQNIQDLKKSGFKKWEQKFDSKLNYRNFANSLLGLKFNENIKKLNSLQENSFLNHHIIGIIDYGCGNVGSVQNMFSKIGVWSEAINDPSQLSNVNAIVLPGVGSFDTGVARLKESGFWDAIKIAVENEKKPILGICLGMQLFFDGSEEGTELGFGWIPGKLERFNNDNQIRIPHMGWETLQNTTPNDNLFDQENSSFYFTHTFHAPSNLSSDYVLANCFYGSIFPAAVRKENIVGFQFHPEKSLSSGMHLLNNWCKKIIV